MKHSIRIFYAPLAAVVLSGILLLSSSCQQFVELEAPPNAVAADQVFANDVQATAAINGIYSQMIGGSSSFSSWMTTVLGGSCADELLKFNGNAEETQLTDNEIAENNSLVLVIWSSAYRSIYQCNKSIEALKDSKGVTTATQKQLMGECYFLRAFCYSYLYQSFGDVPLLMGSDYLYNMQQPRTAKAIVADTVMADIQRAYDLLPAAYASAAKGRANKWAAAALAARQCLLMERWQAAADWATEVLNKGGYLPLPPLQQVYLAGSKEAIWQLVPDAVSYGYVPELKLPPFYSNNIPGYYLRAGLLQAFEPADKRRTAWIDSLTYQSKRYYYPGKYKSLSGNTEYYVVLRAAELLLIRAEALARLQQTDAAIADLNVIRLRASLPPLAPGQLQDKVLEAVYHERRCELFAEWGHRWYDLKRTGLANTVLPSLKGNSWQPFDVWWPIPESQILANPLLTQNEGY